MIQLQEGERKDSHLTQITHLLVWFSAADGSKQASNVTYKPAHTCRFMGYSSETHQPVLFAFTLQPKTQHAAKIKVLLCKSLHHKLQSHSISACLALHSGSSGPCSRCSLSFPWDSTQKSSIGCNHMVSHGPQPNSGIVSVVHQ